jgi:hypothetical protein
MRFHIENNEDKKLPIKYLESMDVQGKLLVEIKKPTRSSLQNRALHLYCSQVAVFFNEIGYEFTHNSIIGLPISSIWTMILVKEKVWKAQQMKMYGIESTTQLTTEQINNIYDAINLTISTYMGEHLPFPSHFSLYVEMAEKNIDELV